MSDTKQPDVLAFRLEDRAGIAVVAWPDGACRPAWLVERELWAALTSHANGPVEVESSPDNIYAAALSWRLRAEKAESALEEMTADRDQLRDRVLELKAVETHLTREWHALRAERDAAHGYLSRLLTHIAPKCEPLDDLSGVVTQIDNLLVGIVAERDALRAAVAQIVGEMRTIAMVAGQCSVEEPDNPRSGMAAAESARCAVWAERLDQVGQKQEPKA